MVVVCGEGIRRCDGVEVGVVKLADVVWRVGVKYEAVDVVLNNLETVSRCLGYETYDLPRGERAIEVRILQLTKASVELW